MEAIMSSCLTQAEASQTMSLHTSAWDQQANPSVTMVKGWRTIAALVNRRHIEPNNGGYIIPRRGRQSFLHKPAGKRRGSMQKEGLPPCDGPRILAAQPP